MSAPFTRTKCACAACIACCKRQPGPLAPGDFERIAEHLGETTEEAKAHFCASPGAVIRDTMTGEVARVGTITPKRRGGRCVFLDEHNRCRIHSVAPAGCSYFDTHQPRNEAMKRSLWLIREQSASAEYKALRDTLEYATSYKPQAY